MGKHRKTEEQPLSDYWKPPADSGLKDGVGEPVACVATTFEFDAGFFEADLLPRFLGLRFDHTENERTFIMEREEALASTRIGVLADISKFNPRQTTLQWDQLPIQVPGGIQHAKVTLLAWERLVRLIVGSANLTRPGYRRNRELFAALDFFDDSESAPLNLLRDALNFTDTLCGWSRALPAATHRIREATEQVRTRVRRWSNAPPDFRQRERPRVSFIAGHPAHSSGSAQSVLNQFMLIWLPRRVIRLTVMTPFVGQQTDGEDTVLRSLGTLPMAREAEGWLIAPETPTPEGAKRRIVSLPQHFGQCWKNNFGQNSRILLVPPCVEGVNERPRDLHAKAVYIEGDSYDLMMIGSSNFTPHGMGIGAYNCEANLVFEDKADENRDGQTFDDRLGVPGSWDDSVNVEDIVWQNSDENPEDTPSAKANLPAFFAWASYSQTTGEIQVSVDRSQPEPLDWSISLPGHSSEQSVLLFSRSLSDETETLMSFGLEEKARATNLTALLASWVGVDETRHERFISVGVKDRNTDLLPPEEFRNLSLDGIIECLLSCRTPAEWIEREYYRRKQTPSTDAAIESLHAVDTSNYLLYRVRRFGRALAAMADRIARTPPTPDAIRYRLLRDPLGPVHLAETLFDSGNRRDGGHPHAAENVYQLYVLAEMLLSLGYVGRQVRRARGRDWKRFMPLFREARERVKAVAQKIRERSGPSPDDMNHYLNTTLLENARLLNIAEEE